MSVCIWVCVCVRVLMRVCVAAQMVSRLPPDGVQLGNAYVYQLLQNRRVVSSAMNDSDILHYDSVLHALDANIVTLDTVRRARVCVPAAVVPV